MANDRASPAASSKGAPSKTNSASKDTAPPPSPRSFNGFSEITSFIWGVADLLRGDYKQADYGKVILPLTVIRRLDCVLDKTKAKVLAKHAELKQAKHPEGTIEKMLLRASGTTFYNTSKLDFEKLKGDPNNIGANLTSYIKGFVNDAEEIRRSFQPYYQQTVVAESADPHQLYELQHRLEAMNVFWKQEVEAFCKVFYAPKAKQTVADQAEMYRALGPGVDRFKALDEEKQEGFRNALRGYVRLYGFLSQVMPFADEDLEKLYTFARYLELKLPRDERKAPLDLDGDVALKYYRLDKILEASIALSLAEQVPLKAPTDVGTRKAKGEDVSLSEVIEVLNERFGTEFGEGNALLVEQFVADAKADQAVVGRALANPLDNFELSMKPVVDGLVMDRMDRNQEIATAYFNESEFANRFFKAVVRRVYDEIRRGSSRPPPSSSSAA